MKKIASLLLLVSVLAISAAKAQTDITEKYNATTAIANFISQINTVTTEANWSGTPSGCDGTTFLCSKRRRVTSGTLPTHAEILAAENDYFNPNIGNHSFPGCGVEFDLVVPLTAGGTKTVKITYFCKD